jgi:hypothetical protein
MACIDAVPVLSEEQFRTHLELVSALTSLLADQGAASRLKTQLLAT